MNSINKIKNCEVCGNDSLDSVLNLGSHPMCDDLVSFKDERKTHEYPIEILFCTKCKTAHQKFQVPKKDLFPESYHYRSRFTADVLNGMASLVTACEEKFGNLNGRKILDIGCNDGSLLDLFARKGAITFGIEPTGAAKDANKKNHTIINSFFTEEIALKFVELYGKPDFISFTNVFAHIENLKSVIDALNILMHKNTILVIENHYLGAILKGNQFDTFYHEHPRSYSLSSFEYIAKNLNRLVVDVDFPSRYGGNIRVFISEKISLINTNSNFEEIKADENLFNDKFLYMSESIPIWIKNKKEFILNYVSKHGKLIGKAFPGRAAILIKLLNLDVDLISAIYEKPGSMKIGHYLPGTRIPILSDDDLFSSSHKEEAILNLAWHIPIEIRQYLKDNGFQGNVVDIIAKEDFLQSS